VTWDIRKVVAAVDGSEQSVAAARAAIAMAGSAGASVDLITVVRPPEGWWGLEGSPPSPEALAGAIAAGRKEVLDRVTSMLPPSEVEVNTVEELGDPAAVIIAHCESVGADLLVVGRRGAGVVERLVLGSVADRLAHEAPCPVLIVP
jgi:nucleotide-binding universal stress UspA family protein